MSKTDAAYMREYRARKKAEHAAYDLMKPTIGAIKMDASKRIRELEEEVRHLKEELAKRPTDTPPLMTVSDIIARVPNSMDLSGFNTRPFTPVPKKGK